MMKARILLNSLIVSCLFFVAGLVSAPNILAASRIYFDPATSSQAVDSNFQINVKIDAGGASIFGADAVINFPSDAFTVQSVNYGSYFSDTVAPIQSSGEIILRGSFFSSATGIGTGAGTFATINFVATKAAGTGTVSFTCSSSDIIDSNGNNILACGSLNQLVVTFTTGGTASPTPTQPPGDSNPPTNACGGTCGSNYNCNGGLFCYQGFCRDPLCKNQSNCVCPSPTPKPTVKPTVKPNPTVAATPAVIKLAKATPYPSASPSGTPEATPAPKKSGNSTLYIIWGVLAAIAIAVIAIAFKMLRKNSGPPKITPPTTMPENPMPPQAPPPTMPPPVQTPPTSTF